MSWLGTFSKLHELTNFSLKGQMVNMFSFLNPLVAMATTGYVATAGRWPNTRQKKMIWPCPNEASCMDTSISIQCNFHFHRSQNTIFLWIFSQSLKNVEAFLSLRQQTRLLTPALETRTQVQEKGGPFFKNLLYIYSYTL